MDRVKVVPKLHVAKTGVPSSGRPKPWTLDIQVAYNAKFVPDPNNESRGTIEHNGQVVASLVASHGWRLVSEP